MEPPGPRTPILAFHKVDSRFEWGVTRVTPAAFGRVAAWLASRGYRTVSLEALCGPPSALPEKPLVITFDDSYESVFENAFPVLERHGFTATVFVVTGHVGRRNDWDVNLGWITFRHLSWGQLRRLKAAGWEIGSHSVHHPDLTRVAAAERRPEMRDSRGRLEDGLGAPVRFLSFPFGRYNEAVLADMGECGYERGAGFWLRRPRDKSLVFERRAYYLFDGRWSLRAKLGPHPMGFLESAKLRAVNFCSHGTALVKSVRGGRDAPPDGGGSA